MNNSSILDELKNIKNIIEDNVYTYHTLDGNLFDQNKKITPRIRRWLETIIAKKHKWICIQPYKSIKEINELISLYKNNKDLNFKKVLNSFLNIELYHLHNNIDSIHKLPFINEKIDRIGVILLTPEQMSIIEYNLHFIKKGYKIIEEIDRRFINES